MHVDLGRQLKDVKAIIAKGDTLIDCSSPCSQELHEENFLGVVLLSTLGVRKCQGCNGEMIRTKCPPLKDFAFCMQLLQTWKDQKTKEW